MLQTNRRHWTGKMRKAALAVAAVLLAAAATVGCAKKDGASGENDAEIVATYKDGGQVTRGEYNAFVGSAKFFNPFYEQFEQDPEFVEFMVKQLIAYRLLSEKADEQVKKDAESESKAQFEQLSKMYEQSGDKEALNNMLKQLNITSDDLQHFMVQTNTVFSDAKKQVTDEQIQSKYEEKAKENAFTVATVRHILIAFNDENDKPLRTKEEALQRAQEVKAKLDAGEDFATLAKTYSDDPGSKDNGGLYENADVNDWVAAFKQAAIELPIGKISDPVETEYGYHVMRVEARSTKTLDEVKDDLKSEIAQTKIMDYVENEIPKILEKIVNLPTTSSK